MSTKPLTVGAMAFHLNRLHEDCSPLQEIRELTQNAIEAILKTPDQSGEIRWDADWNLVEDQGVYKLCISDNGVGMSGEEIDRYINGLSSSGGLQSLQGNYGVGAKITALPLNPEGLVYVSWRDGQGVLAHLWLDPETGEYGLREFQTDDGTKLTWVPVSEDAKPGNIGEHGTKVMLLGRSADHHTMVPPDGTPYPTHWLTHYLNRRYFRFPEGVSVKVREFNRRDPDEWPTTPTASGGAGGAQFREVNGMGHYLAKYSVASGTLPLTEATASWWLLPEDPKMRRQADFWQSSGHVAALYQNELYEFRSGQTGKRLLQLFGVLFGASRVVVYVEPHNAAITSNTARSSLIVNGEPLPWELWAEEFWADMPDAIEEMLDEVLAGAEAKDYKEAIRKRLSQPDIRDLFRFSRYRRTRSGAVEADGEAEGGDPAKRGKTRAGKSKPGGEGGALGDFLAAYLAAGGTPATEVRKTPEPPDAQWISIKDGTRETGDLEDRAARYLPTQNQLLINADFRAFTDMIELFKKERAGVPAAEGVIRKRVHEWFAQQLIEAVMGMQALRGSREWPEERITSALSEEGLTAAVMPRYSVYLQIKRGISSDLGSAKEALHA